MHPQKLFWYKILTKLSYLYIISVYDYTIVWAFFKIGILVIL